MNYPSSQKENDSGYRQLKHKRELIAYGRKKIKLVIKYVEDLFKFYAQEANYSLTEKQGCL